MERQEIEDAKHEFYSIIKDLEIIDIAKSKTTSMLYYELENIERDFYKRCRELIEKLEKDIISRT